MFRAIHIGNFKAFGPTQRIPIRPLTLIFGPNSAGKSSFIHALLFTHEALTSDEPNNLDVHRPRIGGDSVDLGGFRQFVHRGNTDAQVELSYEFGAEVLAEQNSLFLSACHSVRVTFGLGLERLDSETGIPTKTDRSPWVGQVVRRIAPDKRESIDKLLDHAVQQGLAVSHSRAQILIKIKTGDPTDALAVPTLVVVSRDGDVEVVTKWLYRDLAPILGGRERSANLC
ncbi:MAG: hypothetical protein KatS3mg105_2208 [Gemmatales bacterium]|nr:MAG: hypothetical protein KatS3mg105_2208 [Gemmatales bacterium]